MLRWQKFNDWNVCEQGERKQVRYTYAEVAGKVSKQNKLALKNIAK